MTWVDDLQPAGSSEEKKARFAIAAHIIRNRFEYLVDGLDLQLIRTRRAQGHCQLNRTGVGSFRRRFKEDVADMCSLRLETPQSATSSTHV
jgi:hypothetical protein